MIRYMTLFLSAVVALVATSADVDALTVCHDFTLYRLLRIDSDNKSRGNLVDELKKRNYRMIYSFNAADRAALAKGQRYLRTGDVVIMGQGNGHSGIMTAQGLEHFIQVPGESGKRRDPNNLPVGPVVRQVGDVTLAGGYFRPESLEAMIGRLSGRGGPPPVEIWSKVSDLKVTMTWNTKTDVDLWVEEPGGAKCWYQNRRTNNGGALLEDVTSGFGPEHYALARSVPGVFVIKANYYSGPRNAKVEPTTVTLVVTEFDGMPNARTQTFRVVLNTRGESRVAHTVRFD